MNNKQRLFVGGSIFWFIGLIVFIVSCIETWPEASTGVIIIGFMGYIFLSVFIFTVFTIMIKGYKFIGEYYEI